MVYFVRMVDFVENRLGWDKLFRAKWTFPWILQAIILLFFFSFFFLFLSFFFLFFLFFLLFVYLFIPFLLVYEMEFKIISLFVGASSAAKSYKEALEKLGHDAKTNCRGATQEIGKLIPVIYTLTNYMINTLLTFASNFYLHSRCIA